jgi:hypothetical protein
MALAVGFLAAGAHLLLAEAHDGDPGLPESHWNRPLPAQGSPPSGWPALWHDLDPQACGQCHQRQFDDWRQSLHAHAFSAGLVGQFPGLGKRESNRCLDCHAPLAEQKFAHESQIMEALEKLGRPSSLKRLPLRHAGVSCASCHVRNWRRYGPPPRDSGRVGQVEASAHGGFYATRTFEQSRFCAACHQFPQSAAVNGKPLENTVEEWRRSRFAKDGIQCQTCHMPDRRHEFKGIHDPAMTRKGLEFDVHRAGHGGELIIRSTWIGHAFPTYVTPRVIVMAEALDKGGKSLRSWSWEIVREVVFEGRWREIRDSRLMPGQRRSFQPGPLPAGTHALVFRVRVLPDDFYKGVYRSLLASKLKPAAARQIRAALDRASENDYLLFEQRLDLP